MGDIFDMFIRMNKRAANDISNIAFEMKESVKSFKIFRDEIRKEILESEKNHNKPIFPNTPYKKSRSSKRLAETSSSDEESNVSSTRVQLHISENVENTSSKPKRGAAKAASANIKKVSNMKLNSKMRRPSIEENSSSVFDPNLVKIEKRSESMILEESAKSTALSDVTNENMPPPTSKPKRGRKKVKKETDDSDVSDKSTERTTRTRSTRSRVKEQPRESTKTNKSPNRKDSDVLIQEVPVTVVVVTDSESETEKNSSNISTAPLTKNVPEISGSEAETNNEVKPEKAKRGRKPKKQTQNKMKLKVKEEKITQDEVESTQDEEKTTQNEVKTTQNEVKTTQNEVKTTQDEVKNATQNSVEEESVYEDAISENKTLDELKNPDTLKIVKSPGNQLNETHIISKNTSIHSPAITDKIKETGVQVNCTVVLESIRSTFTVNPTPEKLNETKILQAKPSLLTDDDDSIEVSAPIQTPNKKLVKTKPIFSPYGSSPVKKRVAAFEKLGTADAPARVTRTKTRNLAAAEKNPPSPAQETPASSNRPMNPPTTTKTKKFYTPLTNNKLPTMIPQLDSKHKNNKNTSVMSTDSAKSLTAVKASRAELQERREEEQKRKLEHESEVKRKKEALLQAKIEEQKRKREEKQLKAQKAREAKEREKEEKIRRIIQEKEEKLQKEEQMKREWMNTMAKKAADEEKRQQMIKQEKLEQKRKLNIKPPPLPTDDLQDTDEEDENPKHKYIGPVWSQRQHLYPTLHAQRFVPTAITKEFFQMQAQTPDLLEIFENVNADVLRRNSSAVWRTPPRYSTLPKF